MSPPGSLSFLSSSFFLFYAASSPPCHSNRFTEKYWWEKGLWELGHFKVGWIRNGECWIFAIPVLPLTLIEENRKFFYGSVSPQKPTSSFATYSYCSLKRRRRTNGGFLFLFDSTTAFKSIIHAYAYHVRKPMLTLSGGNWSLEQRDFFPPRQQGFLIKVFPKAEAPESRSLMQLRENYFRPAALRLGKMGK